MEMEKKHLPVLDASEFEKPRPYEPVSYTRPMNTPWCQSPFLEQQIQEEKLPPELAAAARKYAQDGFLIIDPQLPESVLDGTISDMEGHYTEGGGGAYSSPGRIQDSYMFSPNSRRVASDPRILDMLYFLYRRQPIPFQTLNFPVGTQQRTHSDIIHFHCFPHHFMCGVWIALEDIDLSNGPLHYYPGSQKLPIYDMYDLGITAIAQTKPYDYYEKIYEDFVESLMKSTGQKRTELQIKKGQALVWSANLFHGGSPILDPTRSRHSQVTHYYFTDCVYTTPLMSDYVLGKGHSRQIKNIKNLQMVGQAYNHQPVDNAGIWPPHVAQPAADPLANLQPLRVATDAPHRIVAWPRYDDPSDVQRIFSEFAKPLVGRQDVCLCLRFDRNTDRALPEAIREIEIAYEKTVQGGTLNLLILDDEMPQLHWPRIGGAMTAAISAGGPPLCAQDDFIRAMGVPVFHTAEEMLRQIGTQPAPAKPAAAPLAAAQLRR
jgi:hypothetical protein